MMQEMFEKMKRQARLIRAYRKIFNGPDGELVLSDLVKISGLFSNAAVARDAVSTAFHAGRRSLMIDIIRLSKTSEERIIQKIENLENERGEK
jgi:hypothetical protein